jgi:hypothetical protein
LKTVDCRKSLEPCSEAGWFAYDYLLDSDIDKEFITSLRPLGSFVYLSMLKQPFFKIENHHFIIKGIQGTNFIRIAVHGDYLKEMNQIVNFIKEAGSASQEKIRD